MDFFDLHCDTATSAMEKEVDFTNEELHIHYPLNKKIEKHCQCFAIFCPDEIRGEAAFEYYKRAEQYLSVQCAKLNNVLEEIKSFTDVLSIVNKNKTAAILTVEGGSAINGKIENLYCLHNDGVKMMTLTWNGENELGFGSLEQEKGLKPFGIEVIKEMEKIGMYIDVSHLSDRGFENVAETVDCPIVASHSNLREICSHRRNLTDEYFSEIVRRKGIVGINFYKAFINNDPEEAKLSDIAKHIERMLKLGGKDSICLGSDYDGCDTLDEIKNIDKVENLYNFLIENGFGTELTDKIFWKNAYNFFERGYDKK